MSDPDLQAAVYPIGVVQTMTELSGRQLRYYEKMGLLEPERTKGNQRLYSPVDVERLLQIKALLAEGLNIEGVRARLETGVAVAPPVRPTSAGTEAAEPAPPTHSTPPLSQRRPGATRLASLYPVRDQAALSELLQTRRAGQDASPSAPNTR